MSICGSVCFAISDINKKLDGIDKEIGFSHSKLIIKDTPIVNNRLAPKNIWIYDIKFSGEDVFECVLRDFATLLHSKKEIISNLKKRYEDINITIYIRSDYGQIGITVKEDILYELSSLNIDISFDILSYGLV